MGAKLEEINGVMGKACSLCDEWHSLSDFYKSPGGIGGKQAACKKCDLKRRNASYMSNRELELVKNKNWRMENKEHLKEYRQKNKRSRNEQTKEWREKNPNYLKEWAKKNPDYFENYFKENPHLKDSYLEYQSDYGKQYRFENKEKLAKYKKDNKEREVLYSSRRRARKKLLPDNLTIEEQVYVFDYFGGCALTGDDNIHWDHVIPLSIGHGGTTIGNMIPLRIDLNMGKHDSNIFKWFDRNKKRLNLCQNRFDHMIQYLATKNDMTIEGYKKYVNKCHAKPKVLESQQITLSL